MDKPQLYKLVPMHRKTYVNELDNHGLKWNVTIWEYKSFQAREAFFISEV